MARDRDKGKGTQKGSSSSSKSKDDSITGDKRIADSSSSSSDSSRQSEQFIFPHYSQVFNQDPPGLAPKPPAFYVQSDGTRRENPDTRQQPTGAHAMNPGVAPLCWPTPVTPNLYCIPGDTPNQALGSRGGYDSDPSMIPIAQVMLARGKKQVPYSGPPLDPEKIRKNPYVPGRPDTQPTTTPPIITGTQPSETQPDAIPPITTATRPTTTTQPGGTGSVAGDVPGQGGRGIVGEPAAMTPEDRSARSETTTTSQDHKSDRDRHRHQRRRTDESEH